MSAKRPATTDLNHTNWNDEVEPEERGEFRLAPEEEINKRVIKKARRRVTTASAAGAGDDVADSSSSAAVSKSNSVFGNFAGFGSNAAKPSAGAFSFLSKIPAVAASATNISSSGLTAPPAAAKPMFSFAAKPAATVLPASSAPPAASSSTTTIATKPTFSFGNPTTAASSATITLSSSSSDSSNSTSLPDIPQTITTTSNVVKKSSNYCAKLKVLNKVVSDWIKSKVDDNPTCLLTPIFKEYEGYLNEIEAEETNETKATTEKKAEKTEKALSDFDNKTAPASAAPKLTFGAVGGNSVGTTPKSGSFLFGNLGSSPAKTTDGAGLKTNGSIFGNAIGSGDAEKPSTESDAKTSTFSFGFAKPAASASVTSTDANTTTGAAEQKKLPFSFSGGAPSFSFGNIKPLAAPMPSAAEASKEDDDDDEEPPKEEIKPVVEDDAVYSKKCKVFVKHDSSGYADRGVGTLYLKPVPGSNKKQLVVRAETNLGKILLNLILNEAVPTQRTGKNNVMLVCVPTPEEKKSSTVLVRVKTSEDADELLETIEKYKK